MCYQEKFENKLVEPKGLGEKDTPQRDKWKMPNKVGKGRKKLMSCVYR